MNFEPWISFREFNSDCLNIEIAEPPCKHCEHWRPQRKYMDTPKGQIFDGVVLCHSKEMHGDFSCYKERAKLPGLK